MPVPEGSAPSPSEGLPASVKGVGSGGKPKSVRKSPRLRRSVSEIDLDEVKESSSGVLAKKPNPFNSSHCEVEKVVNTRLRKGVRQYKVKWKGYCNRFDVWRDEEDLECSELIAEYNSAMLCFSTLFTTS